MKNDILIQIVKDHFEKLTQKNKRFSKRSFAQKIGLSSGALTDFLSGKRGISKKKAAHILTQLGHSESEQAEILKYTPLVNYKKNLNYKQLECKTFNDLLSWEHLAILSLLKTKNFTPTTQWITKKLALNLETTEKALKNLEAHNLIKKVNSQIILTNENVETYNNIPSEVIKKSHLQDMDIHKENLLKVDLELRDMSSITLAFDLKKMILIKSAIRMFQEQLAEIAETSEATEVYKLSVYLGPLSKLDI